jgi:hypothetical protein
MPGRCRRRLATGELLARRLVTDAASEFGEALVVIRGRADLRVGDSPCLGPVLKDLS